MSEVSLKYCPYCAEHHHIADELPNNIYGYKCIYDDQTRMICLECGNKLVDKKIPSSDYIQLIKIKSDETFVNAMIELYTNDIIEYTAKMSQFKNQQESSSNVVKCPYCNSPNTKKITTTDKVVNTALWGVFGTKRHKNYHCNNCNSDF